MTGHAPWAAVADRIGAFLAARGIKDPPCGFYVGPGWLPVVEGALDRMIAAGWDRDLQQVKQKFGGLRIYVGNRSEAVDEVIVAAEEACAEICETCGQPHGLRVPLYGSALCPACKGKPQL